MENVILTGCNRSPDCSKTKTKMASCTINLSGVHKT